MDNPLPHPASPRSGPDAAPGPRDRLLQAAADLFCLHGINAVGVDAIVDEAKTAKTTLYKLFGSKDRLVEAVLEAEGSRWRAWFLEAIDSAGGTPRERLDRIFPALQVWFGERHFYGCPFINAVGEHDKRDDRLRRLALNHKQVVLGRVRELVTAAGARDPELLAHQIGLLVDGAIVAAMITKDPGVARAAAKAADRLIDAEVAVAVSSPT